MNDWEYRRWYLLRWLETPKARILIFWCSVFFISLAGDLSRLIF